MAENNDGYGLVEKARGFLRTRKASYQQVFEGHGAAREVLMDLAQFCRADETTFHNDPRKSDVLIGRREVWLRIQEHLHLSNEELFKLTMEGRRRK